MSYKPTTYPQFKDTTKLIGQERKSWKVLSWVRTLCSCFRPHPPPLPPKLAIPAQRLEDNGKKTLVLDLDETLLHGSFEPVASPDFIAMISMEGEQIPVYVNKRPGVEDFLMKCARVFEIVVFTASVSEYANPLIDLLDTGNFISYRLYRNNCIQKGDAYVKDLSILNRDLSSVVIVDDTPDSYELNPDNAVPVQSWYSDSNDCELKSLFPILSELAKVNDVRTVIEGLRKKALNIDYLAVHMAVKEEQKHADSE